MLGLVLVVAAAVLAWGSARSRPAVLLLAAYTALLAAAPTWYLHYAGLTAPVLAIVLGASVQRLVALPAIRRRPRRRIVATAASLAILALPLAFVTTLSPGQPFPAVRFRAAVAGSPGCVTSDHPTALILTDSIGRNIERGCPLVIDLGGYSHDFSRGQDVSRRANQAFQDFALSYLRTGSRAILARFSGTVGWSRESYREIQSWPVVVQSGELSVRVPR